MILHSFGWWRHSWFSFFLFFQKWGKLENNAIVNDNSCLTKFWNIWPVTVVCAGLSAQIWPHRIFGNIALHRSLGGCCSENEKAWLRPCALCLTSYKLVSYSCVWKKRRRNTKSLCVTREAELSLCSLCCLKWKCWSSAALLLLWLFVGCCILRSVEQMNVLSGCQVFCIENWSQALPGNLREPIVEKGDLNL